MGGIFGLWRMDDRPVVSSDLERMSERLRHRGPDGTTVWLGGTVGLGHAALNTTPEAGAAREPLNGFADRGVLVADARIDNRAELLSLLGIKKPSSHVVTDNALLMAALGRWGGEAPRRLVGEFAFVFWNPIASELICVRDHFGVKPLYYTYYPGRLFAFASEIQALLTLGDIRAEIDEDMVARHLRIPIPGDLKATYFRDVLRVKPAHVVKVSLRGVQEKPYWEIDLEKESIFSSVNENAEALRETFVEAVRCRTRSNGPIGSMLSGGIDSSAITAIASRTAGSGQSPIHTLSAIYPLVPESDERRYIDDVLEQIDSVPHFFAADSVNPIAEIDEMNRFVGGVARGRNLYLNWELSRKAKLAGAHVVLDGFDGDAIVSHGEGYLSELAIAGKWLKLAGVAMPFSCRRGTSPVADYRSLVRYGRHWRRVSKRGLVPRKPPIPPSMPLNGDFASRFVDRVELPELRTSERETHGRHLHSVVLLEALGWIEACGAAQGVEVRFPFFDVRLAELCVSLPPDQKLRRGWTRFVMRKAMEGIIPRSIQWRAVKTNMYQGWNRAYRTHGADRVRALLSDPSPIVQVYIDTSRLNELHERFVQGSTTDTEESILWRVVSLALWLSPLDGVAPQMPGSFNSMSPRSVRSQQ